MKKIFSLVAIAAVAATMFTSCKDSNEPPVPPVGKAKLSITATPTTIAVGAEGTFTVTSDINAPEAIVVAVKSSDDKILTVDPASVTIAKGTKTITGKFKGVAENKATITITTTTANTTITTASVEITVGDAPIELPELLVCDEVNSWSGTWLGPEDTFGFTLWFNGGVMLENLGADYYGSDLALTAVEKGTDIATLTLTKNLAHITMGSNKSDGFDQLPNFTKIGAAQYVVFSLTDQETDDHNIPQTTGWALVSASDNGNSVILHEMMFPATKVGE